MSFSYVAHTTRPPERQWHHYVAVWLIARQRGSALVVASDALSPPLQRALSVR